MTAPSVRVRYAPSPTGDPHVGNIRTALFNWLYARHTGGTFILRIEDTDQARAVGGALDRILDSLDWLGLDWDEGPRIGGPYAPYIQSERLDIYHEIVQRLLAQGDAYYCTCTPEELAQMRTAQQQRGEPPRYDRRCRDLTAGQRRVKENKPKVVRFKTPLEGEPLVVHDIIRGDIAFELATLDDFVILKSDGFPTYHLANVVDDNLMEISHIMRAEEWLPSTPRHLLLYRALACEPPIFAHLPMILGRDRSKLSKRHGATSLLAYRDLGYVPEAVFNFLALMGWSLDDKTEIISRAHLVRHFSLERVLKSPAIFDLDKLTWMNGMYLRQLPHEGLAERMETALATYARQHPPLGVTLDKVYLRRLAPLVQDRLKTLKPEEVWDLTSFFLQEEASIKYNKADFLSTKLDAATAASTLLAVAEILQPLPLFEALDIEDLLRPLADHLYLKTGQLFGAIRIAVTGRTAAPPLFDTLAALGKERVLARLHQAARALAKDP